MPNQISRRTLLAASLVAAASACAHSSSDIVAAAAQDDDLDELIRHRIQRQRIANAAIVATIAGDRRRYRAVRYDGAEAFYPLGPDTIFEIASLTKIFTALLLAAEVVDGRMRLDDPLQAYLPAGVTAPAYEGQPITLADLATHGSGLPLRPNNLVNPAADAPDKYAGYTLEELYGGLPDYRLAEAPGASFRYSNLAFALLGHAIANREGAPFDDVLQRRILKPLGLADTSLFDDPKKAQRRARGYDLYLDPVGAGGASALSPAYGLRSSADDLRRFLDLFLNDRGPATLVKAARLMLSVDRPGEDQSTRMALGWRRTTIHGETYYWSNGSGDGSRCFMGFNPARRMGVAALADAASGGGLDDIGRRVLDPQQEVDLAIVPAPQFIKLTEEILLRATGIYDYAPDDYFEITRGVTGLIVTAGPTQLVIRPTSPSLYASAMAPGITFEFDGVDAGPARGVTLHQFGESYYYRRR